MERFDLGLSRAHRAYERAHVRAAAIGLAIAGGVTVLAAGLHHTTQISWLIAIALAGTLGALGWRGGSWKRGAFAGVLAGLPPLIVPSIVTSLSTTNHCASCAGSPTWFCVLACFGSSSVVGALVGHRASLDRSAWRYGPGAVATALLTGLLGCGTTGIGGALGIAIGLVAGAITGWLTAGRTAHAAE